MSILHFGTGNTGNSIIKPATPDLLKDGTHACGFDQHDQLWVRWEDRDDPGRVTGTIVADVRTKTCPICKRGWENNATSIRDQTHIDSMKRHAHRTCMDGYGHVKNFFFWHNLVCERPMNQDGLFFKEIPNEYGSSWTGPWYHVTYNHLREHALVLGSRKRVYNVEITDTPKELVDVFVAAFKDEKTTQDRTTRDDKPGWLIHAWTNEKAEEYVRKIVEILVAWKAATKPAEVLPVT